MRTEAARKRAKYDLKVLQIVSLIAVSVSILVKVFDLHLWKYIVDAPWAYAFFLAIKHELRELIQEEICDEKI